MPWAFFAVGFKLKILQFISQIVFKLEWVCVILLETTKEKNMKITDTASALLNQALTAQNFDTLQVLLEGNQVQFAFINASDELKTVDLNGVAVAIEDDVLALLEGYVLDGDEQGFELQAPHSCCGGGCHGDEDHECGCGDDDDHECGCGDGGCGCH